MSFIYEDYSICIGALLEDPIVGNIQLGKLVR